MIIYAKIPREARGIKTFAYTKNGSMTRTSRIPQEVMEKFAYTTTVQYDEEPSRRRCIFCDAPQKRQRYLTNELIDLCEWHYQHARLGQISQQIKVVEAENATKFAKEQVIKEEKRLKRKKRKKNRKTALSKAII